MTDFPKFSLEELEKSKRIFKSATPKYTTDWYIKWVASVFILAAMSIRGVSELVWYDLVGSIIGIFLWLIVSILWKDRALIILNAVGLLFLIRNLALYYA
jgi:fatty-acid desaturase|tara:strand:+ start:8027 stop:8326 length:300 start_codon:yes stop_codon:yes gene_type:complete